MTRPRVLRSPDCAKGNRGGSMRPASGGKGLLIWISRGFPAARHAPHSWRNLSRSGRGSLQLQPLPPLSLGTRHGSVPWALGFAFTGRKPGSAHPPRLALTASRQSRHHRDASLPMVRTDALPPAQRVLGGTFKAFCGRVQTRSRGRTEPRLYAVPRAVGEGATQPPP